MLIKTASLQPVLLQVIYYMPMYPSLLQEFTWGYDDHVPDLIRTHQFLNHWHKNIDAVISEVLLSVSNSKTTKWQAADFLINYKN